MLDFSLISFVKKICDKGSALSIVLLYTIRRQRVLNIRSKTLAFEISDVVQNAINDGRNHLNDDEANHLIKISEKLIQEYVKKLENSSDD